MKKWIAVICLMVILPSCATKYQEYSKWSGGFKETRVSQNKYRVYFYANDYTEMERAKDYALRRAAELTLQHGHDYFTVQRDESYRTEHISQSSGYYDASTGYYSPGHFYSSEAPSAIITILMQSGVSPEGPNDYDARFIMRNPIEK